MNVVTGRLSGQLLQNIDWRAQLSQDIRATYESMHKSLEIPAVLADVMRAGLKGELNFGVETRPSPEVAPLVREIAQKVCLVLLAGALLILAGLVVQAEPRAGGVSVYSLVCFLLGGGTVGSRLSQAPGPGLKPGENACIMDETSLQKRSAFL